MIYTREHIKALHGQYVVLLFNRSGVQNNAFEQMKLRYSFDFEVISIDINPPPTNVQSNVQSNVIHITGDWRTELDKLVAQRGEPAIIIANPPCTYNTFLAKQNSLPAGGRTEQEEERAKFKEMWLEVSYAILDMQVPVVILENPMGFMDKVITCKDSMKAYMEVHPWMFVDQKNINKEDMHDKRTHLFSGGSMDAILEHPVQDYILTHAKLDGVEKNWVKAQKNDPNGESASDKRSKISPGMALGITKCAIDRFLHSKQHPNFKWLELTYHKEQVHPPPKILCCNTLPDGKGFCNLRKGHAETEYNMRRGLGLACGIFCYEKNVYTYKVPEPTERICKVTANLAIHDTMFKSSHKQDPATEHREVRKVYTCSICGKPKKGHVCNFKPICKYIKTTTIRKVYTCRLCGMPKKGHICKFSL